MEEEHSQLNSAPGALALGGQAPARDATMSRLSLATWMPELKEYIENERPAMKTGLPDLDRLLCGGFRGGLYVFGGQAGYGKTALAVQMARQALEDRHAVFFYSFELGRYAVGFRFMSRSTAEFDADARLTMGDLYHAKGLPKVKGDSLSCALSELDYYADRLFILDGSERPGNDYTAASITADVKACIRETGERPLVIVDHLQAMPKGDAGQDSETHGIEAATGGLRDCARLNDVPIVLLSCLTKQFTFKGSSNIEHDATAIGFLRLADVDELSGAKVDATEVQRAKEANPRHLLLEMRKVRDGQAGTVRLQYWPAWGRLVGEAES